MLYEIRLIVVFIFIISMTLTVSAYELNGRSVELSKTIAIKGGQSCERCEDLRYSFFSCDGCDGETADCEYWFYDTSYACCQSWGTYPCNGINYNPNTTNSIFYLAIGWCYAKPACPCSPSYWCIHDVYNPLQWQCSVDGEAYLNYGQLYCQTSI